MQSSDPKSETPELLAQDGGYQGIEAHPGRVERYSKAKRRALDVAQYMRADPEQQRVAAQVLHCGDYLAFRHYYTVDEVRLHGAVLCRRHLLCQLCAIRRGARALRAYLERWESIQAEKTRLRPFLVTLTVKDGPDLRERFQHLKASQHELWKRKQRKRGGSWTSGIEGAVWSYEIKRGSGSGLWHPHLHMIALAESLPDARFLSAEWESITGDSRIVDVRPIEADQDGYAGGFCEVFKYSTKFSEQPPADTVTAWSVLRGRRLLASAGVFRNVVVPEVLTDDELDLPYVTLFYRYVLGSGYRQFPWRAATARPYAAASAAPRRPSAALS